MKNKKKRRNIKLVKPNSVIYNNNTDERKEGDIVAGMINKLNGIRLTPKQLMELGLDSDWQKKVSPAFVEKVVKTANKYRDVLKELSKH